MFYFIPDPVLTSNLILTLAAVIPAVILMVKVYRSDRIEKESRSILTKLVIGGVFATFLASLEESIGVWLLECFTQQDSLLYMIIENFVIVAIAEESSKYIFLKKESWNSHEFDCQYDGVVYAVFVSLGFALLENVYYVLEYGFSTALTRALTAVPGHACFGVFMGVFYGLAKRRHNEGNTEAAKLLRVICVIVPALLHGTYDFIASTETLSNGWYFTAFIAVMFALSYLLIVHSQHKDRYI